MYAPSDALKKAITGNGRTILSKIVCGDSVITSGIRSIIYTGNTNPDDHISIGGTVSNYVEISMFSPGITLDNKEITLYLGINAYTDKPLLYSDDTNILYGNGSNMLIGNVEYEEFVKIGLFTVQKPKINGEIVSFTAYDRMFSYFDYPFLSDIEYPTDGKKVLQEISEKTGVPVDLSALPDGVVIQKRKVISETTTDDDGNEVQSATYVNPFDGYTYRESIGYIAQMYGKFATIDRDGVLVFRWYEEKEYAVTPDRYYDDLVTGDNVYKLEKIYCSAGDETLFAGEGTVSIQINNPVMTQENLDYLYSQVKGLEFLPASFSILGDMCPDLGDIIKLYDKQGNIIRVPIMNIVHDYDGGLQTYIASYGKTEAEESSGSTKGPTAQAIDRLYKDLIQVKEIIGTKASFEYAKIIDAKFDTLDAGKITTGLLSAERIDIDSIFAKNITATGTITGVNLVGSSIACGDLFSIDKSGNLKAAGADITGTIKSDAYYLSANGKTTKNTIKVLYGSAWDSTSVSGFGSQRNIKLCCPGFTYLDKTCKTVSIGLYNGFFGNEAQETQIGLNADVVDANGVFSANTIYCRKTTHSDGSISSGGDKFSYSDGQPGVILTGSDANVGITGSDTLNPRISFMCNGAKATQAQIASTKANYITINASAGIRLNASDADITFISNTYQFGAFTGESSFRLASSYSGKVSIGTSAVPWSKVYASSTTIGTSDKRDKEIVGNIDERFYKMFMKLHPTMFRWKDHSIDKDGRIHLGLIAQEAELSARAEGIKENELAAIEHNHFKEPMPDGRMDRYGIAYEEMQMLTMAVTQKNANDITKVEGRIQDTEKKINAIQKQMRQLRNKLAQA